MSGSSDDLYDRIIESNRYKIVKYIDPNDFYDPLREKSILNVDDQEEIEFKHGSRRKRAAAFLDTLQKKGTPGVESFLEILEFEYPELFKEITGKAPRAPPPNFKRKSKFSSMRLNDQHLASIVVEIRDKNKNNQELMRKIEDMDNIIKYEQNENKELEKETEDMRKKIKELEKNMTNLEIKMAEHIRENNKLKDDSLNHLQSCLAYAKQCELYRERWALVQSEKDELERTLHKIRESQYDKQDMSASRSSVCKKASVLGNSDSNTKSTFIRPMLAHQTAVDDQRVEEEKQILRDKLEEMQESLDELVEKLQNTQDQLDDYQSRYAMAQKNVDKVKSERDKLDELLQQHSKRNDSYFEMIEYLQKQKNEIEQERMNEQRKVREESQKYSQLFGNFHRLQKEHLELQQEHERFKAEVHKRDSQSSKESDSQQIYYVDTGSNDDSSITGSMEKQTPPFPDMSGGSDDDSIIRRKHLCNLPNLAVHPSVTRSSTVMGLLGQESVRAHSNLYDNRAGITSLEAMAVVRAETADDKELEQDTPAETCKPRTDTNVGEYSLAVSDVSEESLSAPEDPVASYEVVQVFMPAFEVPRKVSETATITVKLEMAVLEKMEFTGGNVVGIYIKQFHKRTDKPIEVGDKVLSIGEFTNGEPKDAKHTDMTKRTLEEAKKLIQSCTSGRSTHKHIGRIIEIKVERNPLGYEAAQAWMSNHQDSGDFFYVKCRSSLNGEQDVPNIEKNDVYCVMSTTFHPKYWTAVKFDTASNTFSKESVLIPNSSEFFRLIRKNPRTLSSSMPDKRKRALRHRPYNRVLPVKACMDMVIANKVSFDSADDRPAQPLPMDSQYQEKIHWHAENKLSKQEVEKYRYLLGNCSGDTSFSTIDHDTEPLYARSISVSTSHN